MTYATRGLCVLSVARLFLKVFKGHAMGEVLPRCAGRGVKVIIIIALTVEVVFSIVHELMEFGDGYGKSCNSRQKLLTRIS